jgi:F0F1-type ATP synthase gamma subunit
MEQSPEKLIGTQLHSVTSSRTEAMKNQTKNIKNFINSITQLDYFRLY